VTETMDENRKLVFISHANPEDNDFTLWLAGRLASLGYLVWSDITKLIGAEIFWDKIEEAIREHAAKTVVVLSRIAQEKDGVLDEVQVAVTVERSQKLNAFVVPVRIDDLPFSEIKPNLARKNIIDFKGGWADGLKSLLEVFERDGVPRVCQDKAIETSTWFARVVDGAQRIESGPQTLMSNWAEVASMPKTLHFFRVPVAQDKVLSRFEEFPYPVFPYANMVATSANEEQVNTGLSRFERATKAHDVPLNALFNDELHPLSQRLQWSEAVDMLSYMLRTAWDKAMKERGLRPYELSSGRKAWYPAGGYADGNWMKFLDIAGAQRRKRLVGRSNQRKVNWHFAVEAVPYIRRESKVILKPHVVFTEDGVSPLASASRMHSLRRGFCKNWWNERWRGLLLAYAALIADETGTLILPVGDGQQFIINSRPLMFEAPVHLGGISREAIAEDQTDSELDEMAVDLPLGDDHQEDEGHILEVEVPEDEQAGYE